MNFCNHVYYVTSSLFRKKEEKCKGSHVLADFTGLGLGDEYEIGNFIFNLMIEAIDQTSMKIVHSHLEILNKDTPPGFTSGILLLDSSHFTAHCYSDLGIIAMDLFTCDGEDHITDVMSVMKYVQNKIVKKYPNVKCTYMKEHKRFRYS